MSMVQSTSARNAGNGYCMPHDRLGETIISRSHLEAKLLPIGDFVQRMYGADPHKAYYPFETDEGIGIFVGRRRICVLSPTLDVIHIPDGFTLTQGDYVGAAELVRVVGQRLRELEAKANKVRQYLGGDA